MTIELSYCHAKILSTCILCYLMFWCSQTHWIHLDLLSIRTCMKKKKRKPFMLWKNCGGNVKKGWPEIKWKHPVNVKTCILVWRYRLLFCSNNKWKYIAFDLALTVGLFLQHGQIISWESIKKTIVIRYEMDTNWNIALIYIWPFRAVLLYETVLYTISCICYPCTLSLFTCTLSQNEIIPFNVFNSILVSLCWISVEHNVHSVHCTHKSFASHCNIFELNAIFYVAYMKYLCSMF